MAFYAARITRVVDGDTVTGDINLGFGLWKHGEVIRLNGIDAPELKSGTKEKAKIARDYLKTLVLERSVQLETFEDKRDRWGRLVANIFVEDMVSIGAVMIEKGHAVPYLGDIFEGNR